MTETPIDAAHAAMQANTDDPAARLGFFERLADSELFVLLAQEPEGDKLVPDILDVEDGPFVLAFDSEERLAAHAEGRVAPYAAMSGRILAEMLDGQGIGLGLNVGVAPSSILFPAAAMTWLVQTLHQAPEAFDGQIAQLFEPADVPQSLIDAIKAKLARAAGLVRHAHLVGVEYRDGSRLHLLAFVGAHDDATDALAKATHEAVIFSGAETIALDVGFFDPDTRIAQRLNMVGMRIDLPEPPSTERPEPLAPGRDPDKPPILR